MSGEFGKAMAQKVTTRMSREKLEEHIATVLRTVRMCTLVTSKGDINRGTPLEYFSDGLTVYISPDPGTKTKNLKANSYVTISIYNNLFPDWEREWQTIWGIQITGTGILLPETDPDYEHGREVIDFRSYYRAAGKEITKLPEGRKVLKVIPSKIELVEFGLVSEGFAPRQVWRTNA